MLTTMEMGNPFEVLFEKQNNMETLLRQLLSQQKEPVIDTVEKPIGKADAAEFLCISVSSLEKNLKKIPHHRPGGVTYFFRSELYQYVKDSGTNLDSSAKTPVRKRRGKQRGTNQSVD